MKISKIRIGRLITLPGYENFRVELEAETDSYEEDFPKLLKEVLKQCFAVKNDDYSEEIMEGLSSRVMELKEQISTLERERLKLSDQIRVLVQAEEVLGKEEALN